MTAPLVPSDPIWQPPARPGPPRTAEITPQMAVVLSLLCLGLNNREIARRLFVTVDTVKTHMRRLYAAIGARDRVDAVGLALSGQVQFRIVTFRHSRTETGGH
jgi:DNA-binding NarL/FixJ family response regulator